MKKELSFEERKKIQLDMLDEIDAFCIANNIRYSIAFGTLLGAIRHKGFIPWDDDVDIMMPLPDLLKFKQLFKSENLKYLDVDIDSQYGFPFSRIAHKHTYNKEGVFSKSYGICIDLYILINLPNNSNAFFNDLIPLYAKRINANKWRKRIIRYLPFNILPNYNKIQISCRDYLFNNCVNYGSNNSYYVIAGPLKIRNKTTYDRDLFKSLSYIQFEDRKYMAISEWNYFLSLMYGNYMQLPPEDQRHPYHGGHYYWKEKK